jgi:hypothetical protein
VAASIYVYDIIQAFKSDISLAINVAAGTKAIL